ncbi:MAG: hypothetical protein EAZ85_11530, partial [Bacteroidetes bacterium]
AKKSTTSKVKGEPNWLKWEEVQKKYPNQWVFLGYKKGAGSQLYDAQLDVLCTATTFEEISELEKKYSAVPTEIYKSFGLQHTQIVKPSGKKVIPIYAYTVENS